MKTFFEAVSPASSQSFLVRTFEEVQFSAPYHYHPELELTCIIHGEGKRYVGSEVQEFKPGDLVLLGPNLPHCWKTDPRFTGSCRSIVVHFKRDFLGEGFFERPELKPVAQMLSNSQSGIRFESNTALFIKRLEDLGRESSPFTRLMLFLDILYELSQQTETVLLDRNQSFASLSGFDQERIHKVMGYVVDNLHNRILLQDAAATINMTANAFCRYFRKITRKTFIEAVNDYRVDHAVNQLIHTDKPITTIGYECGFSDSSNFYRIFRKRMKVSPLQFRKNNQ